MCRSQTQRARRGCCGRRSTRSNTTASNPTSLSTGYQPRRYYGQRDYPASTPALDRSTTVGYRSYEPRQNGLVVLASLLREVLDLHKQRKAVRRNGAVGADRVVEERYEGVKERRDEKRIVGESVVVEEREVEEEEALPSYSEAVKRT